MNKTTVYLLFSIGLVLTLIISNPKEQAHKDAVKSKVNSVFQKNIANTETNDGFEELGQGLGFLFGGLLIEKLVDNYVTCDNYLLFSLTKATVDDKTRTIGFGVLGNVFISSEINNVLNDFSGYDDEREREREEKEMRELEKNPSDISDTKSETANEEIEEQKNKIDDLDISVRNKFSEWEKYLIDNSIFDCVTEEDCKLILEKMKLYNAGEGDGQYPIAESKYPMKIDKPTYLKFEATGDGADDYIITYGLENCVNGNGWTKDFVILISEGKSTYKIDKELANDLKTKFWHYAAKIVEGGDDYVFSKNGYIEAKGLNIDEINNNEIYGTFDLIGKGGGKWPTIKGVFYYDLISKEFSASKLDE